MNKIKWFAFSLMLILLFPTPPSLAETELGGGRISLVQGRALLQTGDEGEWTEASLNFPIANGDRIITEWDGKIELQFKDGTYVRMGEGSTLDMIALNFERTKSFIHLNLLEGRIYINRMSVIGETPSLYIDLPNGILSSHIPARFRVDLASFETKISVLQGGVDWTGEGRTIPLPQGRTLIVRAEGHTVLEGLYGKDEWDRWNEARDNEIFNRRYAQKYLPPELEPWGYEIEPYGRWVYIQEYQYVWIPIVSVEWAPFRHGHWTWRKGVYCWVPREPWGWVPFHYGRWIYLPHHGWVWVPPVPRVIFWHPGAVAWHVGPTHISWVPLAPGEIYYDYRYYGPYSINLNRSNLNIQRNVLINAKVKDAVVTIPRESFFKRQPVTNVQIKENPFLHPGRITAPPAEKPFLQEKPKIPLRVLKGLPETPKTELKTEKVSLPKEGRRQSFPLEPRPKGFEPKQPEKRMERPPLKEPFQNRAEKLGTTHSQEITPSVGLEKRNSLPSQTPPPNHPNVQGRIVAQPSPIPQPIPPRVQEVFPQRESVPNQIVRRERPLFPKERVDHPPDYQEKRVQKNPASFSGEKKWRTGTLVLPSGGQKFNGSTPPLQERIETTSSPTSK